jgi:hypothetical protein
MDEWQEKAFDLFPELRDEIDRYQPYGPTGLWIDLFNKLQRAYDEEPVNDEMIKRIYGFAVWCFEQPSTNSVETDLPSAAAMGLIEDIPLDTRVANDLYRWMSVEAFDGFENLFRYHLSESEYGAFREEFMRKKKDFSGDSVFWGVD